MNRRSDAERFITPADRISPATITVLTGSSEAGSDNAASTAGGNTACVIAQRATLCVNASLAKISWDGMCSDAPLHRAITTSNTHASKLKDANCKTRLLGVTPRLNACAATRLLRPPCATMTPLGIPVEPEV